MESGSGFDRSNGTNLAFGGNSFSIMNLDPGFYTVTCTRKYYGNISGSTTSYIRTFSVIYTGNAACCPNPPCHEARMLNEKTPSETFEKTRFAFWPNPAQTTVTINYKTEVDGEIEIKLIPLITNGKEWTLTKSHRPEGSYQETYYVNALNAGLYLLSLTQNGVTRFEKILISNQN